VGTHALLAAQLNLAKLGLAVIDEQHRFGVSQRAKLAEKGTSPHILTMTATPIPRTVALTLYGDLDLSVLDEMPKNRLPVKTWAVPAAKRAAAYEWIKEQQTQTFIICPLIEESTIETMKDIKAVKTESEKIKTLFPGQRVGLLHGRLKNQEKEAVLTAFRQKELDILVATPVVEVGIDIPAATIMVIEGADRFGLAQLHQLRGRVGRGGQQAYCLLFTDNDSAYAYKRLKHMERLHDGRALSELDLKLRGPGERFGLAQHGRWDLKIADFSDTGLIENANKLAEHFLSCPADFPVLSETLDKSTINIVPN
jgi:ATP-dependent DNA helicase RecG